MRAAFWTITLAVHASWTDRQLVTGFLTYVSEKVMNRKELEEALVPLVHLTEPWAKAALQSTHPTWKAITLNEGRSW